MARSAQVAYLYAYEDDGTPVSGATAEYFVKGTSTPATVYADSGLVVSLGTVLDGVNASNSAGRFPLHYYNESVAYDVVVKRSNGTTLQPLANVLTPTSLDGLGQAGDTVAALGFWRDITAATQIWRMRDRVFVGEGADATGNRAGSQGSILPTATEGANWALRDTQFLTISDNGLIAITGISRSNDQNWTATECIGVAGFVINNKASGFAWGLYSDLQHESGASFSAGLEVAAKNKGSDITTTPYTWTGTGVYGLHLASGGDSTYGGASTNPSTAAVAITKNALSTHTWNTGIVFRNGSLTLSGTANAMVLPANYAIRWDVSDNTVGARLYSTVTTSGLDLRLVFQNSGIKLAGASEQSIILATHVASAVNSLHVQNSVAGSPVIIGSIGTDTNVDIRILPQADALTILDRVDTATNAVSNTLRLRHTITGTPTTGVGVGMEFQVETSDNNFETGAVIEAVTTDVTGGSEDFDLVLKTMAAGATAAERLRVSLSVITVSSSTVRIENANPNLYLYESDQGVDGKLWATRSSSGSYVIQTRTDADVAGSIGIQLDRSGTTISQIQVGATLRPTANDGAALGTATASFSDAFLASGAVINYNNGTYTLTQAAAVLTASGTFVAAELRASGDVGGAASHNSLTNVSDLTANSSGVGTILFKGATSRNSAGFIKIYIATTAHYIPCFTAITG